MASAKAKITLTQFIKKYGTEEACRDALFAARWPNGFVCPKCGGSHFCMLSNGHYQCAHCHHQTSVTAGTIMQRSHVSLTNWFLAFYLVSQDKRGISACQLKTDLGVTYKTAWYVLKRIRAAMGQRDKTHLLSGRIEFDDAFFGGPTVGKNRGRGTEKAKVFVALSLDDQGKPQYLKMKVTANIKKQSVKNFAEASIEKGSTIHSDGYRSYGPALEGYLHKPEVYNPAGGLLHWIHIAISNAKTFILGTYHGLPKDNLQAYLDEYCYRFSRRWFGGSLFDRLLLAMAFEAADPKG